VRDAMATGRKAGVLIRSEVGPERLTDQPRVPEDIFVDKATGAWS